MKLFKLKQVRQSTPNGLIRVDEDNNIVVSEDGSFYQLFEGFAWPISKPDLFNENNSMITNIKDYTNEEIEIINYRRVA